MPRVLLAVLLIALAALPIAPRAQGEPGFVATLDAVGPGRAVVIGIHGGAWYGVGRELSMTVRDEPARSRRQGWDGVIVDHPRGGAAVASVLRSYDKVRARYPGLPLCLDGESAGGHLALLVAAALPEVAASRRRARRPTWRRSTRCSARSPRTRIATRAWRSPRCARPARCGRTSGRRCWSRTCGPIR